MNILLKELKTTDFPIVKEWIDPKIFRIFTSPIDDAQLTRLLTKHQDGIQTDVGKKAIDGNTGNLVGFIHAVINAKNEYAHVQQIVVHPEMRNQGYGTSILRCFLDICFRDYNLHRVQLCTDENNHAAISCYKKVGFKVDGLVRDITKEEGGYLGEYIFSILDYEWIKLTKTRNKTNSAGTKRS
jgi:RimJ/RimL family protein N-acetyltransferase